VRTKSIAVLVLGLAAVLAWPEHAPDKERARRRDDRLEWGLYQIHWGRRFPGMLERSLEAFASRPDYVMFYRDMRRGYPRASVDAIRRHGATPIVSQELWYWGRGRKDDLLPRIAAGEFDGFFRAWARAARAHGKRVLYRFGFEMNGDWFTWSGRTAMFRKAWRRAHGIFRAEKAANVEWVWSPNVVGIPRTKENGMHRYYPGDEYVDWVGVDGYNFGDEHDEWHEWESFESVFDDVLDAFAKRYPDKPVMIAETGCAAHDRKRRVAWIREAHAYLRRRPQVKALVWFHYDKRREGEPNWRIDATKESLAAFNDTFARPREK